VEIAIDLIGGGSPNEGAACGQERPVALLS